MKLSEIAYTVSILSKQERNVSLQNFLYVLGLLSRIKTKWGEVFPERSATVSAEYTVISYTLLHAWEQTIVQTMGCQRRVSTKKD